MSESEAFLYSKKSLTKCCNICYHREHNFILKGKKCEINTTLIYWTFLLFFFSIVYVRPTLLNIPNQFIPRMNVFLSLFFDKINWIIIVPKFIPKCVFYIILAGNRSCATTQIEQLTRFSGRNYNAIFTIRINRRSIAAIVRKEYTTSKWMSLYAYILLVRFSH